MFDFLGNEKNDEVNEDVKSLNESLLFSNLGLGFMDFGLKWFSYGNSIYGNLVWVNIFSVSVNLKFFFFVNVKDFNLFIKFGMFMFLSYVN